MIRLQNGQCYKANRNMYKQCDNLNGRVIMYADKITNSMQKTIHETDRRRIKQEEYNRLNGITPVQIQKSTHNDLIKAKIDPVEDLVQTDRGMINDPVVQYMNRDELEITIKKVKAQMEKEAKKENFMQAAQLRDELFQLKKLLIEKLN